MPETHGLSKSKEYNSWKFMRRRCNNPNYTQFYYYGGRGIQVCKRWNSFINFLEDMGKKPTSKHSIERRNNNGNYKPSNCYWATPFQQARNTKNNKNITFKEKTLCQKDWSIYLGGCSSLIRDRLKLGWSIHKIFSTPVKK